ncbi:hypothetical protein ACNHKD_08265 [Methylocystis sp. JAN1]|uniref:hypothetical protein n=1 Tax=Methylocystis sp. JAN1 TaxID=3397211 RepID=UPI003FA33566
MAIFKLPLSGDVPFSVAPWTNFGAVGNRFAFLNVELGHSSAPEVEGKVLDNVGSYGKQLGRMGDALRVLLDHFEPDKPLSRKEKRAIRALQAMLDEIDDIKRAAGRAPSEDEPAA